MNARVLAALTMLLALPLAAQSIPQYTVQFNQVSFGSAPALHSFARAVGPKGQWLIVSGRTNGLHTFTQSSNGGTTPPANAFPPQQANTSLWVIDPIALKVYSANNPAPPLGDSLAVNNAEFYQDGDTLYVVGGYGNQSSNNQMTTFSTITAIPVTATINAIMSGSALPAFPQVNTWYDCVNAGSNTYNSCLGPAQGKCQPGSTWSDCMKAAAASCAAQQEKTLATCNSAVLSGSATASQPYLSNTGPYYAKVAGGGMDKVGSIFWMVFGQDFDGLYSVNPGDYGRWPTAQVYTERYAALWLGNLGGKLSGAVLNVLQSDPNSTQWHRRDLNVLPAIDTNGSAMISTYGGVFVPGQIAAFQQPVYLHGGTSALKATTSLDSYQQLFSQYDCATLKMYSASANTMQTMFFGGIGLYYISPNNGTLQQDTGLPFVNTLSVLSRNSSGTSSEVYSATPLPTVTPPSPATPSNFWGANATFIPNPAAPRQSGEILALDKITTKTLAGWVYGGILAPQAQPPNGGTIASNAIFEVWITPCTPPSGYWNSATAGDKGVLKAK